MPYEAKNWQALLHGQYFLKYRFLDICGCAFICGCYSLCGWKVNTYLFLTLPTFKRELRNTKFPHLVQCIVTCKDVFRTQSNIYDGAFLQKLLTAKSR